MEDEDDIYLGDLPPVVHKIDEPGKYEVFEKGLSEGLQEFTNLLTNPQESTRAPIVSKVDAYILMSEGLTLEDLREAHVRIGRIIAYCDEKVAGEEAVDQEKAREARLARFFSQH